MSMLPENSRPTSRSRPVKKNEAISNETRMFSQDSFHRRTDRAGSLSVHQLDHDVADSDSDDEGAEKRDTQHIKKATTLSKAYEEDEEKAVVKKFDRKLVLFLAFLYMLSFLDRSNIGNARIAGLEEALQLSDRQFDYCLVVFYITYITFEWMILLYRLAPAHVYISLCVLSWGLVASLQSVVTSFRSLLALRACLGITEAAFGPGVPFYMTFFYRRSELAYRVGLQISAAPLATSFASSLAWVIVKISQNGPIEPWRALFLFEGFPSIITAIFAWYFIPDSPETARYLTSRERIVAKLRLQEEQQHDLDIPQTLGEAKPTTYIQKSLHHRIKSSPTLRTLSSTVPWLQALIFLSINVAFASLPVFLPTIINSMSFSPLASQILSAPPYLVSFAFVLFVGRLSDSIPDSRGVFLASCAALSATSYFTIALFGALASSGTISEGVSIVVRYAAVYGAAMGLFASVVLIITWNLNNQPSRREKGLAMMIMNVVGQCGPLIGVNLFPKRQGPYYTGGMAACGGFLVGVVGLVGVLRWKLGRLNEKSGGVGGVTGSSGDLRGEYEMATLRGGDGGEDRRDDEAEGLMDESNSDGQTRRDREIFRYML